jgi:pimeloyl-ACP methyl ester carboxylesterase
MPTPIEPLTVPSLVFTGEHDLFTPANRLCEFSKLRSNLRVAEIAQADHMYHLEQTQETLQLIDNFVAALHKHSAVAA